MIADVGPWAGLLATCFERSQAQMEALLAWFHDGFGLVAMGAWDGDRREMFVEVEGTAVGSAVLTGIPVKLDGTPGTIRTAPPRAGEDTDRILRDILGFDRAAIDGLRASGAIQPLGRRARRAANEPRPGFGGR